METLTSPIPSCADVTSSALTGGISTAILDWDEPLSEEELVAIDAAVEATIGAASNHKKRPRLTSEDNRPDVPGRRLPRSFSLSPCQVNEAMRCPSMTFGGQILYSRTAVEVEKAAIELSKKLSALKSLTAQITIGFDIEWRPTFRRGGPIRKAAVMQICCDSDHCYVMHIIHSGVPPSLKLLLEDSSVVKAGVGIVNDAFKLHKDYNLSVKACEDLSTLANTKLVYDQRNWSLASLTEILASKQLPKPKSIRLGNWEALFLSKEQLHYAATDAFASWYLHQVLKSLPDLKINNVECDVKEEIPTRRLL